MKITIRREQLCCNDDDNDDENENLLLFVIFVLFVVKNNKQVYECFFEHESYESNESLRVAPLSLPSGRPIVK